MGYTKRQFIEAAFEEIGYASYAFDLQPEQLQSGMRRLDNLMAEWNAKGIRIGYPVPSGPEGGDLDDAAAVPDSAWQAIVTNLAVRIAPIVGKTVMQETRSAAKRSFNTLIALHAVPNEMQLGPLPAGAGNVWFEGPFLPGPVPTLDAGPDGQLEFN